MREIKFRAYFHEYKMMDYNPYGDEFLTEGTPVNKLFTGFPFGDGTATIMPYTGLKDKNGVEIYEGDIIAHEVNNMRGAVVWNPASYCYSIDSLDGSEYIADLCDYDWNPEVIGNIYENSELLK